VLGKRIKFSLKDVNGGPRRKEEEEERYSSTEFEPRH